MTVIVDVTSGRPDAQIEVVNASFTLTEIATQKVVLNASTFARASFDIPGSAQRFAQQRAARNADDRAVEVLAQNIRNRLASFFVAGT
jgi:LPS-assembly lipoprotein